jgi:hypothetical protein
MGVVLMVDLVINERRREPRRVPSGLDTGRDPTVPGARVLEVLDASAHGQRCRLAAPVRPGRTMPLRLPGAPGATVVTALVVRCEVCRLSRQGVQYEAAWALERPWRHE